jgi:hypothetical protein
MNGKVVYDVFQAGSDNTRLGFVIVVFIVSMGFIYLILGARRARRDGLPLRSKSRITMFIWNVAGAYPVPIIGMVSAVSLTLMALLLVRYQQDKRLLEESGYVTRAGTVVQYTTVAISGNVGRGLNRIAGVQPTLHERDRLVVDGMAFFLQCDRPPDLSPGIIGETGKCIGVQIGRSVRVDYVQVSPTEYRAEPLRVWLLDQ